MGSEDYYNPAVDLVNKGWKIELIHEDVWDALHDVGGPATTIIKPIVFGAFVSKFTDTHNAGIEINKEVGPYFQVIPKAAHRTINLTFSAPSSTKAKGLENLAKCQEMARRQYSNIADIDEANSLVTAASTSGHQWILHFGNFVHYERGVIKDFTFNPDMESGMWSYIHHNNKSVMFVPKNININLTFIVTDHARHGIPRQIPDLGFIEAPSYPYRLDLNEPDYGRVSEHPEPNDIKEETVSAGVKQALAALDMETVFYSDEFA